MFCFLIAGKLIRKVDLFKKKKKTLACRELLKRTERLVLARNTSSCLPKSINLKAVLAASSGEAGGAFSSPFAPSLCSVRARHRGGERGEEAAGSTVPPSTRCPHPTLNTFSQRMEERCLMAGAEGFQGIGWAGKTFDERRTIIWGFNHCKDTAE